MSFAFLHGPIVVSWIVTGVLAEMAVVAVIIWWCWHPPRNPKLPTAVYLLLALLGYELWISNSGNLSISSVAFALTLPWSGLALDIPIPRRAIVLGIALNAVLLYLAARSMSRYRRSTQDAG